VDASVAVSFGPGTTYQWTVSPSTHAAVAAAVAAANAGGAAQLTVAAGDLPAGTYTVSVSATPPPSSGLPSMALTSTVTKAATALAGVSFAGVDGGSSSRSVAPGVAVTLTSVPVIATCSADAVPPAVSYTWSIESQVATASGGGYAPSVLSFDDAATWDAVRQPHNPAVITFPADMLPPHVTLTVKVVASTADPVASVSAQMALVVGSADVVAVVDGAVQRVRHTLGGGLLVVPCGALLSCPQPVPASFCRVVYGVCCMVCGVLWERACVLGVYDSPWRFHLPIL